jgi:hypothetical protein
VDGAALQPIRDDGIPDAFWINRNLAIGQVARELDCRFGAHGKIHCWHPEKHKNGDRTPSVGIHVEANRVKCFGCDSRYMSVVDLVMDVQGVAFLQAIRWIDSHFPGVPRVPKGKHLRDPDRHRFPVGHEDPLELIVRSGVWAKLSPPSQRILPVLRGFGERQQDRTYRLSMSYVAIMRYSGVGSYSGVSKATKELEAWRLLERVPAIGELSPIRATAEYLLTPYSNEFQELANAVAGDLKAAVEAERELRRQARMERAKKLRTRRPKGPIGT